MKFKALVLVVVAALLVAGCTDTPSTPSTVVKCFCQQLDTDRKAELQDNNGVPTKVWPDIGKADNCIQTTLGIDADDADGALQQERRQGALNGDDGVVLCAAAGYQVDETAPEPASPDVMQAARDANCKMMTETKETPNGESFEQMRANAMQDTDRFSSAFATQVGISKQEADTVLNRAAAEFTARKFKCPGE